MDAPKRKSAQRFKQFNAIVDEVGPLLSTPSHLAVLLVAFRHGRGNGYFRVSTGRLAKSVGLSKRQVINVLDDLENMSVIRLVEEHKGPIPRTYRINFKEVNGEVQFTIRKNSPPELMMKPITVNGEAHFA